MRRVFVTAKYPQHPAGYDCDAFSKMFSDLCEKSLGVRPVKSTCKICGRVTT